MKRDFRGFSLIELIVTLALVAIVAAIAAPQFKRHAANTDLKAAAREVMGDFFNARQMAVNDATNVYRIDFNVAANSYVLSRSAPPAAWEDVWAAPKSLGSFGSGISLTGASFSGLSATRFQQRGTVSAGNVTLRNRLGSTAVITVNITGRTYVTYAMQ